VRRIRDLSRAIVDRLLSPDGAVVVLAGYSVRDGREARSVSAYELATGKLMWSLPWRRPKKNPEGLQFDPSGTLLFFRTGEDDRQRPLLIEMRSGRLRGEVQETTQYVGPNATLLTGGTGVSTEEALFEQGREAPLLVVDARTTPFSLGYDGVRFSRDGRSLASWRGGTITVCNLAEMQRQLTEVGLGW
jgi:hypothetical protein